MKCPPVYRPAATARLCCVLRWLRSVLRGLRGGRPRPEAPRITPRSSGVVARRELADLAPSPEVYLGRFGYLSLVLYENLGRAVMAAPTPAAKSALLRAAGELGAAHAGVTAELRRLKKQDPAAAMEPYRVELDDYQRRTQGADWHEILITCYVTAGFLSDFFAGLAAGLPKALGERVVPLVRVEIGEGILVELLRAEIADNPRLAARLALWGRRLVGDTMLVARAALRIDGVGPSEERIEPVFSELIAAHTRRMDILGLTA